MPGITERGEASAAKGVVYFMFHSLLLSNEFVLASRTGL